MATDSEDAFSFDKTLNGNCVWQYCGMCNRPKLGEEKCCYYSGVYYKEVVERFEKVLLDIDGVRQEIVKYVKKKDIEKRIRMMQQQLEMENALPQKTNLIVGQKEIPKWSGQTYDIWKDEIERWIVNDKSSDKTKY